MPPFIFDKAEADTSLVNNSLVEQHSQQSSDKGILIHGLCELFAQIKELEERGSVKKIYLRCAYFEIYND